MPWTCRLRTWEEYRDVANVFATGDMFFVPDECIKQGKDGRFYIWGYPLSDEYLANTKGKRQPIMVTLPRGIMFCVDSAVTNGMHGWKVSGEAPIITVQPSINIVNLYHGFITNGVISDDCEGRRFEADR